MLPAYTPPWPRTCVFLFANTCHHSHSTSLSSSYLLSVPWTCWACLCLSLVSSDSSRHHTETDSPQHASYLPTQQWWLSFTWSHSLSMPLEPEPHRGRVSIDMKRVSSNSFHRASSLTGAGLLSVDFSQLPTSLMPKASVAGGVMILLSFSLFPPHCHRSFSPWHWVSHWIKAVLSPQD